MAEPSVQFGLIDADNPWGAQTGWNPQTPSGNQQNDLAVALDGVGNEAVSKLYNDRTEYSTPFRASLSGSAPSVPAKIGAVLNSGAAALLEISISTSRNDFAEMTLSGHQHATNPHADTMYQGAHGITLSDGYGAQDFMGATAGASASVQSGTVTIRVEHQDEMDHDGEHFVGNNYHGTIEAETVWTGVPSTTSDGTWEILSVSSSPQNTQLKATTVRGRKALTLALP